MILSGPEIERLVTQTKLCKAYGHVVESLTSPAIDIDPFDPDRVGPNSYDLTLGDRLMVYETYSGTPLRSDRGNWTRLFHPTDGEWLLMPGKLYLGHTVERTECHGLVPWIEGRSSVGRLGVSVHATAGFGDDGFAGQWTLEISVIEPVVIAAGMRICQIAFAELRGERKPYRGRYQGQDGPVASRLHLG